MLLLGVACIKAAADEDLVHYLAGVIADCDAKSPDDLSEAIGPFLESNGCCDGSEAVSSVCSELFSKLVSSGLIKQAIPAAGSAVSKPRGSNDDAQDELPPAQRAPVKLGASTTDSATLDILWGKDSNAFLQQNTEIDRESQVSTSKRALRDARKDADKAAYAKAKAAEEAAAEARAESSAGLATAGTVTYKLTAEGESRKAGQDIAITGFSIAVGGSVLLDNADLKLVQGKRYGLVGRNGMGKTTLLRAMARHDIQGIGTQRFPTNIRVLHVEQEVPGDGRSVLATVLAADVERAQLLAEEAALLGAAAAKGTAASVAGGGGAGVGEGAASSGSGVPAAAGAASAASGAPVTATPGLSPAAIEARLAAIARKLGDLDAHSAEARASTLLAGLGFTPEMHGWPTRSLSGGWRMRTALACALFVEPDILLGDELTVHLDAKTVLWLEDYLRTYPKTLVLVSHDRAFLNNVVSDVIHLHNQKLEYYKGDYDTFERTRMERVRHHEKQQERSEVKRAHMQAFIDKFRYNAKRAGLVQSRLKAVERMEVLEDLVADPRWVLEFPDPGPLLGIVLQVKDVTFGYDPSKPPLLRKVNFGVGLESRIAVCGPNGIGKSTLLKLILGELEPADGAITRHPKLRLAYFNQHHAASLDLTATPLEYLSRLYPGNKPEAMRAHLGSFGLSGDLALQRIGTLSGGQKSRVSLAVLSWKKPHILIADEITNFLDIETIDALIVALGNFPGGVIAVSHDQHFVQSFAEEIWVVGDGAVKRFRGDFSAYRRVAAGDKPMTSDDISG